MGFGGQIARVVAPGVPDHVTQRGNRWMNVFFRDDDRRAYPDLLCEFGEKHGVAFRGYYLTSSHVHLTAVAPYATRTKDKMI